MKPGLVVCGGHISLVNVGIGRESGDKRDVLKRGWADGGAMDRSLEKSEVERMNS